MLQKKVSGAIWAPQRRPRTWTLKLRPHGGSRLWWRASLRGWDSHGDHHPPVLVAKTWYMFNKPLKLSNWLLGPWNCWNHLFKWAFGPWWCQKCPKKQHPQRYDKLGPRPLDFMSHHLLREHGETDEQKGYPTIGSKWIMKAITFDDDIDFWWWYWCSKNESSQWSKRHSSLHHSCPTRSYSEMIPLAFQGPSHIRVKSLKHHPRLCTFRFVENPMASLFENL